MRTVVTLALSISALALAAPALGAQDWAPSPGATMRSVISYEVGAAVVTRRSQGDWMDAVPGPLTERLSADHYFAGMEVGSSAGNGISVRFYFPDMESYKLWNDQPATQQMLAELRQVIGYGYSRSSLSMRRVPADHVPRTTPPRRDVPSAPRPQLTGTAGEARDT